MMMPPAQHQMMMQPGMMMPMQHGPGQYGCSPILRP
jgi:hypothetical protein